MLSIKIFDDSFKHASTMANGHIGIKPKYFEWYRGEEKRDIVIFTDNRLNMIEQSYCHGKINIALLIEPRVIYPKTYEYISYNYEKFDYVLTHHKYLLDLDKRFIYYPYGGTWIHPEDHKIYPKTKNISIIVSNKNKTAGQILRHDIIKLFGNKIDLVCGYGYKPIKYKLDALKDYRYSIVVENCKEETYFTEKLIDCWVTGTIPIYYGCNINGVLPFCNLEDLEETIKICDEKFYNKNDLMIMENFNEAHKFVCIEDWIYENFLRNIINH